MRHLFITIFFFWEEYVLQVPGGIWVQEGKSVHRLAFSTMSRYIYLCLILPRSNVLKFSMKLCRLQSIHCLLVPSSQLCNIKVDYNDLTNFCLQLSHTWMPSNHDRPSHLISSPLALSLNNKIEPWMLTPSKNQESIYLVIPRF